MRREFKDKLCAYCGKAKSETDDHVIAGKFFLTERRANLPKAPSCLRCNGEKSTLEHYLTTVLPFGGRHVDAAVNFETMVPRRLEENAKLHRSLLEGFTGEKIPLESGQIERLFVFIAKGLLWHHWQTVLGPDHCAAATVLQDAGAAPLNYTLAKLKPRDRVAANLGEGTFMYEGLQTVDSPQSTLWRFLVYGGLRLGDSRNPREGSSLIFAVTGPRNLMPNFWATVFREELPLTSEQGATA